MEVAVDVALAECVVDWLELPVELAVVDMVAELVDATDDVCVFVSVVECDEVRVVLGDAVRVEVAVEVALVDTEDVAVLLPVVDADWDKLDVTVDDAVVVAVEDNDEECDVVRVVLAVVV